MKPPIIQKRTYEMDRSWLDQIIATMQQRKWFGTITLTFERGDLKRMVKAESLFPPSKGARS